MTIEKIFDTVKGRIIEGEGARLLNPYDIELAVAGEIHAAIRQDPIFKDRMQNHRNEGCPLRSDSTCDIRRVACEHTGSHYQCPTYRIASSHIPNI